MRFCYKPFIYFKREQSQFHQVRCRRKNSTKRIKIWIVNTNSMEILVVPTYAPHPMGEGGGERSTK